MDTNSTQAKIWPGVKKYNCRSVSNMCSFNLVFDNHSHRGQLSEYLFQRLLSDCDCVCIQPGSLLSQCLGSNYSGQLHLSDEDGLLKSLII